MPAMADRLYPSPVSVSDNPLILSDIYQPAVDFAIWQREVSEALEQDIETLLQKQKTFSFRIILQPDEVADWLKAKWPSMHLKTFQADVQKLVTMFADLFDQSHVGMRLELVDKTLCPLFHVDKVMARMVTTYHGPATEWLMEDNINRQALKLSDHDHVMRDMHKLQVANVGEVLVFKGQDWPGDDVQGIVHRSAQATAEKRRLLLTLDLV